MLEWLNPTALIFSFTRVLVVWSSFYWLGSVLEKPLRVKSIFPLIPKELTGILALMVFSVMLSLFGILNRIITPGTLLLLALPGLLYVVRRVLRVLSNWSFSIIQIILIVLFLLVASISISYSSVPNFGFDDPLITYAVQPDKWLNNGGIYWIRETAFSGFPLTYEMIALWPASLAFDRLDQLSILQVFQTTLLIIAIFRGLQILHR